ncbi:MAG: hypothetical protein JNK92_14200 [Dechloromonas sp.]|nr:hypothetical protein [Dechloromonas sp.]
MEGAAINAMETDLLDWQRKYGTEKTCVRRLVQQGRPEGFVISVVDMAMAAARSTRVIPTTVAAVIA